MYFMKSAFFLLHFREKQPDAFVSSTYTTWYTWNNPRGNFLDQLLPPYKGLWQGHDENLLFQFCQFWDIKTKQKQKNKNKNKTTFLSIEGTENWSYPFSTFHTLEFQYFFNVL